MKTGIKKDRWINLNGKILKKKVKGLGRILKMKVVKGAFFGEKNVGGHSCFSGKMWYEKAFFLGAFEKNLFVKRLFSYTPKNILERGGLLYSFFKKKNWCGKHKISLCFLVQKEVFPRVLPRPQNFNLRAAEEVIE